VSIRIPKFIGLEAKLILEEGIVFPNPKDQLPEAPSRRSYAWV